MYKHKICLNVWKTLNQEAIEWLAEGQEIYPKTKMLIFTVFTQLLTRSSDREIRMKFNCYTCLKIVVYCGLFCVATGDTKVYYSWVENLSQPRLTLNFL